MKPDEQPEAAERLRDPRTIRLLDPACGSMHFGLYAFDLFVEIYREAWVWEAEHGRGSLDTSAQTEAGLKSLSETYPDEAAYLRDMPRLIIKRAWQLRRLIDSSTENSHAFVLPVILRARLDDFDHTRSAEELLKGLMHECPVNPDLVYKTGIQG